MGKQNPQIWDGTIVGGRTMESLEGKPSKKDREEAATQQNLRMLLRRACEYLEHPDVTCIPFALKSTSLAKRIRKALAKHEEKKP